MKNILCVIPSRLASTRLPQKPLALIQGKPMIQWVYEKARQCKDVSEVIVATDHAAIADIIQAIGGKVCFTDADLATGTDRVAAVLPHYPDADVIINLQGDQPFIKPHMLSELVAPYLQGKTPEMTTLACPLNFGHGYQDPNTVKVITDRQDQAIYFSRAPIPHFRQTTIVPVYQHLGLYAFRRDFLKIYQTLPQTPLEQAESLEQLRVLENGYRIQVCYTHDSILEINTKEELAQAQTIPL
jgi:3-deoxy-manno-octulosonate cytidylyltransferase (CMP-KDO synthetase)